MKQPRVALVHDLLAQPLLQHPSTLTHRGDFGVSQRLARHWHRSLPETEAEPLFTGLVLHTPPEFSIRSLESPAHRKFIQPADFRRRVDAIFGAHHAAPHGKSVHLRSVQIPTGSTLDELDRFQWNEVFRGASPRIHDWWETTFSPQTATAIRTTIANEPAGLDDEVWRDILETVVKESESDPQAIEALYPLFAGRILAV